MALFDYNSLKIDFINKRPYYILKVNNFYNDSTYEKIKNEFPSYKELPKYNIKEYNNKFYFNSNDNLYKDIIKNNGIFKDLHESIFSNEFIDFFYKKLFFCFLRSRFSNLSSLLHLLKIPKLEVNNNSDLRSICYLKIKPIIEFSYIKNNGVVVPHTDNRNKLLSLLTYFPEYNEYENNFKKERELGTQFWYSKEKNYFNKHLKEMNDQENFEKKSKKIYKTPFEEKTLFGFIKSQYSWHSVERLVMPENYIRKSINISLLIEK